jgi:methyl-accepting chemotaxis protein
MRLLFGFLAFVLGLVGFLACAGGIVGTWWLRPPVAEAGLETLAGLDDALKTGEERIGQARAAVKTVRDTVEPAANTIAKLAGVGGETTPQDEKEIETMRAKLLRKLDQLEGFVQLTQTAVSILSGTTKAARKAPLFGKRVDQAVEEVEDAGGALAELSTFLKSLHATLETIRTAKEVRKDLAEKTAAIALEIEAKLARLHGGLDRVQSALGNLRDDVAEAQAELTTWLLWAAIGLTALLIWIGLGQWALLVAGMRMMRGRKEA